MKGFTKEQLIEDIKKLGIEQGSLLHLKISLKSIGWIDGGASTLVDAFLDVVGPGGTIVGDGIVDTYPLPLSETNAKKISNEKSPANTGAVVNAMIQHPGMVRSQHPVRKFVAIGKLAHNIIDNHTYKSYADAVLEDLAARGALNISVGKNVNWGTTIHVAQKNAGLIKKPEKKGINFIDENGNIQLCKVNWQGGCTRGYKKFHPFYQNAGIVTEGKIGNAICHVTPMDQTLKIDTEIMKENPDFFFCDDPTCKDCRLHWAHSKGSWLSVKWHSAIKILKDKLH
ncbi:AAC(3) family N-acetyltransferase [Anaerophaga thermohalophila]|uniref:AAC(3) family N-acetyltransferase n=1 Tax=Anaerophaga thermohalophila TaxID=177400 RepID=UPI000237CA5F|nr:AAC(3) family N-acetyltransferase [Anaerophaga thermohalophila]